MERVASWRTSIQKTIEPSRPITPDLGVNMLCEKHEYSDDMAQRHARPLIEYGANDSNNQSKYLRAIAVAERAQMSVERSYSRRCSPDAEPYRPVVRAPPSSLLEGSTARSLRVRPNR